MLVGAARTLFQKIVAELRPSALNVTPLSLER